MSKFPEPTRPKGFNREVMEFCAKFLANPNETERYLDLMELKNTDPEMHVLAMFKIDELRRMREVYEDFFRRLAGGANGEESVCRPGLDPGCREQDSRQDCLRQEGDG